jgi:hypothetical protein
MKYFQKWYAQKLTEWVSQSYRSHRQIGPFYGLKTLKYHGINRSPSMLMWLRESKHISHMSVNP